MADPISELLDERPWLVADGAMGTNLTAAGLRIGEPGEPWNVSAPDIVRRLHDAFIAASADIILTNTFGANAARLGGAGMRHRVEELNRAGVTLARDAANAARRTVLVAGTIGPTGEAPPPAGKVDAPQALAIFAQQATALARAGADVLWLETFTALAELKPALEAAVATSLPVVATMTYGDDGKTLAGDPVTAVMALCVGYGERVVAIGANCGSGAAPVLEALREMTASPAAGSHALVAKCNCGTPTVDDGKLIYPSTPADAARNAQLARDAGARVIGGCCGATPAHIEAIAAALADEAPRN